MIEPVESPALPPFALADRNDLDAATTAFARHGRVQLPDILAQSAALALHALLAEHGQWGVHWGGKAIGVKSVDGSIAANHSAAQLAALEAMAARTLRDRADFTYLTAVHDYDPAAPADDPAAAIGRHLVNQMSAPAMLDLVRQISGIATLTRATASATLYRPGHFLTMHNDLQPTRRVAYVLNLCALAWRDDWGGALQFHDEHGMVIDSYPPRFNLLNLFGVPRNHSVSRVADDAPIARYAIVGWFHDAG